ncbi:MAG: hypothetical protein ACREL7_19370 [Longimicrobiales bacterium]
MWLIILCVAALGFGVWIGLGGPGINRGRTDRVVPSGRARRLRVNHIHWFRSTR